VADVEGTPYWIEAKRHKRCSIPAAWRQAVEATDGRPIMVVTKDDGGEVLVTVKLETVLLWLKLE
jgi:bifunctional DNA-binding transcriptional regulator/antitoxin component of YhaV-PrlF toxin-antitoxin module